MRKIYLLGHPVSQSRSPQMQNAALDSLGLGWEWVYETLDIPPDEIISTLDRLAADPDVIGCNATVPHKLAVFDWLGGETGGRLDPAAVVAHAVNTLYRDASGRFRGDSTDARGGLLAICQECGISYPPDFSGRDIAILGTGGSASSFAFQLGGSPMGARSLTIFGRSRDKAADLAGKVGAWAEPGGGIPVEGRSLSEFPTWNTGRSSLVIQTTTVGMGTEESPVPAGSVATGQIAFDLVYKPHETRFLREAAAAGATTAHGIGMLAGQGFLALERWTSDRNFKKEQLETARRRMVEALAL